MVLRPLLIVLFLAACGGTAKKEAAFDAIVGKVEQGEEMIGKPAPSLEGVQWVDGGEHPLSEDRGAVVLVRWWTDGCPLCTNSAPAIAALSQKHGDGLAVRTVYHNKVQGRDFGPAQVEATAKSMGFPGRVGWDEEWRVLKRWWLDARGRSFTSVTFLLDKKGRVRLIHTGGEFHAPEHAEGCLYDPDRCRREYEQIDEAIAALIAEDGS